MQSLTARLAERVKGNVSNTQQSAAHDAAGRSTSAGNHGLQVRPHRAAHRHAAATTQAPSCKRQPRWWWRVGGACTGPRCGPQVYHPSHRPAHASCDPPNICHSPGPRTVAKHKHVARLGAGQAACKGGGGSDGGGRAAGVDSVHWRWRPSSALVTRLPAPAVPPAGQGRPVVDGPLPPASGEPCRWRGCCRVNAPAALGSIAAS